MKLALSKESMAQLEQLRKRTGHCDASATVEWLVRAMTNHYARIDRENARDRKAV